MSEDRKQSASESEKAHRKTASDIRGFIDDDFDRSTSSLLHMRDALKRLLADVVASPEDLSELTHSKYFAEQKVFLIPKYGNVMRLTFQTGYRQIVLFYSLNERRFLADESDASARNSL
jgi:hypothetical protein